MLLWHPRMKHSQASVLIEQDGDRQQTLLRIPLPFYGVMGNEGTGLRPKVSEFTAASRDR